MNPLGEQASADAATITVTVVFFADLRRFLPRGVTGPQPYVVKSGATVADLLGTIGIAPDTDLTAAVDGEIEYRQTPLNHAAEVMLHSAIEGAYTTQYYEGHPRLT